MIMLLPFVRGADPVIREIMNEFDEADIIVSVAPSYWADIPGQYKAFIDRCTPWCNTHEPHAMIKPGKKGYAIALRTGPNMPECERNKEHNRSIYVFQMAAKGMLRR